MLPDAEKPPAYLKDNARVWWPVLVEELAGRGTLARVTVHRLGIYCQLFAQYHEVTEAINDKGQIQTHVYPPAKIKDLASGEETVEEEGPRKREEIAAEALQQDKLVTQLRRFDKEFGFLEAIKSEDPLEAFRQRLSTRVAGRPASRN